MQNAHLSWPLKHICPKLTWFLSINKKTSEQALAVRNSTFLKLC